MKILIKEAIVFTAERENLILNGYNIAINDGYIEFITNDPLVIADFIPDKVIDARDKIVMPGLVNAHTHSGTTILRNYAGDKKLEEWLFNYIIPAENKLTPEDVYWGSQLAIIEMLKSGTTCIADMYWYMDEVARAFSASGMRALMSKSPLIFKDMSVDLLGCADYYHKWHNQANERIKVYLEVHSTYLYDRDLLCAASKIAKELSTGIHLHLSENAWEKGETLRKYGMSGVQLCLECGIFNVPVLAAHCVHLEPEDFTILRDKKVNVVHNPTSNLKLGSGIAKVPLMLAQGINVALGSDGAASNNNLSIFKEMNLAALIHNGVSENPLAVSSVDALLMATTNGAHAVGLGDSVGQLKPGMKADMIILATNEAHLNPLNEITSAIVYAAQASDVETVIVDGQILVENRKILNLDEQEIIARVKQIAKRIIG